MPTDDIAQPKPCPHGHHRGIGCEPCTLADLDRVKDPSNFRMKMAVSVLALPALVKQRDEARHDLAKLRAAVESVRKCRELLAECAEPSRAQAQRDLDDAMDIMFSLLPEGDETWLLAPPSGPAEIRSTPQTAIAADRPSPRPNPAHGAVAASTVATTRGRPCPSLRNRTEPSRTPCPKKHSWPPYSGW